MPKRELIDTGTTNATSGKGQFKESDDVGRSLRQYVKRKAKTAHIFFAKL
jgi:hypothetical protein